MTMIPFLDLRRRRPGLEQELIAAATRVLARGWYVLGEELAGFEQEFAAWLGLPHAVGVGNGTDAIQLALWAVGVQPGDEVVTVANTCVPTVSGIFGAGARPVLVDADPDTLTLCPKALEKAVTPKTRAIVPVHLYGHACDMDAINAVARAHNIPVVEDCAQAHGTLYRGQPCGGFGAAAAFSFYPTKNLGACGDAGAVVTRDAAVAERLRQLRNYGEERRYYHTRKGVNSRLDEMQAAILRVRLKYLDEDNTLRRERAARYRQRLADSPLLLPPEAEWTRHNYHLFPVRTPRRDEMAGHLKERGIATLIHYPVPVHKQPAYQDLGYAPGAFPVAEEACNTVLSLPMYPELTLTEIDTVADAVADFFQN